MTVYQPYLQGIWPNGVTVAPRPVQATGPVYRSYSGMRVKKRKGIIFGGAHAGHCGSDVGILDLTALRWTIPYEAEAPAPTSGAWKAMKESGGILLGGYSPGGRPWAQHVYKNLAIDEWGRFLMMTGNGLDAYDPPTNAKPEGEWTNLVGNDKAQNEVTFGSGGGMDYDAATRRLTLFATYTGNGAPRGVYTYQFNGDGEVVGKTRVNFPTLPDWNWAYKTIVAQMDGARRRLRFMACPASTWTGIPPFRLFDYFPDTGQFSWDQSLVPGNRAYDEVMAPGNTQGRAFVVRQKTGETLLYCYGGTLDGDTPITTGFWIEDLDRDWRKVLTPNGPAIEDWTLEEDEVADRIIGLDPRTNYCGISGGACGGIQDTWVGVPS
jgi:hypothetical protein